MKKYKRLVPIIAILIVSIIGLINGETRSGINNLSIGRQAVKLSNDDNKEFTYIDLDGHNTVPKSDKEAHEESNINFTLKNTTHNDLNYKLYLVCDSNTYEEGLLAVDYGDEDGNSQIIKCDDRQLIDQGTIQEGASKLYDNFVIYPKETKKTKGYLLVGDRTAKFHLEVVSYGSEEQEVLFKGVYKSK